MPNNREITFVTGNANKLREVRDILAPLGVTVESSSVDLPEMQGTARYVSSEKARHAARLLQKPVLTEDSALCFKAMNDLPGPYIKWFMESLGDDGLNRMLAGFEDKGATAICTFAYCEPGGEPVLFEGRTFGTIVPARGPLDFGWDAIFSSWTGQSRLMPRWTRT